MALRFYFDTHIARAIADQLRSRNIDVVRCEEVGMAEASDEDHLLFATENERIMVSQDSDFIMLDATWKQENRRHAGIMIEPTHLQGQSQISHIVRQLVFYNDAEDGGAVDYSTEIANHIIYI